MIRTGGGRFDHKEENVYFIADLPGQIQWSGDSHDHFLLAVNEFNTSDDLVLLDNFLRQDSIWNLAH